MKTKKLEIWWEKERNAGNRNSFTYCDMIFNEIWNYNLCRFYLNHFSRPNVLFQFSICSIDWQTLAYKFIDNLFNSLKPRKSMNEHENKTKMISELSEFAVEKICFHTKSSKSSLNTKTKSMHFKKVTVVQNWLKTTRTAILSNKECYIGQCFSDDQKIFVRAKKKNEKKKLLKTIN